MPVQEDKELYELFVRWLAEVSEERGGISPWELLEVVKGITIQLRMSLVPEEISLAYAHAVSFMEHWLRENDYKILEITTGQPTRMVLAEEHRFGDNPLAEMADEMWVPDTLPEWLTDDEPM